MAAPGEMLEDLRYERPVLYACLVLLAAALGLFVCFMLMPRSPLFEAIGVSEVQRRVAAAGNAAYWSARAGIHTAEVATPTQRFGTVDGIDKSGKLIVSIPDGRKWDRELLALANATVIDIYGVAQVVGSLRGENARFDIYPGDRAVVWIRGAPLNVKLIEGGYATPDPKPPSNIFDVAFAAYYWARAKGTVKVEGEQP